MGNSSLDVVLMEWMAQIAQSATAREKKLIFVEEAKPSLKKTIRMSMFKNIPTKYRALVIKCLVSVYAEYII